MRRQQYGLAFVVSQTVKQLQHVDTACHIEKRGRLIEQDYGCLLRHSARNHRFLALAVGKFGDKFFSLMAYSHRLHRLCHNLTVAAVKTPEESRVRLTPESHKFLNSQSAGLSAVGRHDAHHLGQLLAAH